ncbi:MAG: hypothetical protein LBK58_05785 [Prevotellaceae bacterium]|jgi:hypothetical protein|nr:hypothetical protein [Prevotellaceae bacterium]
MTAKTKLFKRAEGTETSLKSGIRSRLNLLFFSLIAALALSISFSSCSKDDDDDNGGGNYGYIELSIGGKTYKKNLYGCANIVTGTEKGTGQYLDVTLGLCEDGELVTPDFGLDNIIPLLSHYQRETYLKKTQAGNYRLAELEGYGLQSERYNFDLLINSPYPVDANGYYDSNGGRFEFQSDGKHTVTNIKYSGKTDNGDPQYYIEGTFSYSYLNNKTDKTLKFSGKYGIKITIEPESKL